MNFILHKLILHTPPTRPRGLTFSSCLLHCPCDPSFPTCSTTIHFKRRDVICACAFCHQYGPEGNDAPNEQEASFAMTSFRPIGSGGNRYAFPILSVLCTISLVLLLSCIFSDTGVRVACITAHEMVESPRATSLEYVHAAIFAWRNPPSISFQEDLLVKELCPCSFFLVRHW